jgi:hypothetical protein
MAPEESKPFIVGALQAPEYRRYALAAMQEGGVEWTDVVDELLESPYRTAAGGITATLRLFVGQHNISDDAVVALLSRCACHTSRHVRVQSLGLLTGYGAQVGEDLLIKLVTTDTDDRRRGRFLAALLKSDNPQVREFLRDIVDDANEAISIRARALTYFAREDPDSVLELCWELLECAEREFLEDPRGDRWPLDLAARVAISDAIGCAASIAMESAVRGLTHGSPFVRETTCYGLGRSRNPAAAPLLVERLSDDDERIQRAAVWGLGQLRRREFAPLIKSRLEAVCSKRRRL